MINTQKLVPSPRLQTIKMVEETIKNHHDSLITLAALKRKLPKQVNHNTLMEIIDYLEESNKIVTSLKGIAWIYNPDQRARKLISESISH